MDIKATDLISLFEQSLSDQPQRDFDEIGVVLQVGDGICAIHGLKNAVYGELVEFEGGNRGIVLNLEPDYVSVFLLYAHVPVAELETVKRIDGVFKTPVGMSLLGRVISAIGEPLDGLGDLGCDQLEPVEAEIPGIIERAPVDEPLQTGILAVDALVPIGRGQRELIIGNRGTGKTALAIDTILNQKGKDVYCVYVSVGQRQANLARIVGLLEQNGALAYTAIVSADSSESALSRYLAPYVGSTVAEHIRAQGGQDVLIVYDDLSNHAVAYREMSLLMRRAPGREAYPGDVFYLHSRLLERAGKLESGGSITALPIVQIQSDDITAYIPTNLISITDGQIFLDTKLFNNGMRPALNIELSVSRVGGDAQTDAVKSMTKALKLELAQYRALLDFSQFGTELDAVSQRYLARGARAVELLKQAQYVTYSFIDQALILFLLKNDYLDKLEATQVKEFAIKFANYVESVYQDLYEDIKQSQSISEATLKQLHSIAKEFTLLFSSKQAK
ncbi:F0F1 ATP synthase subunit alpha [bacterium]|jgi:F-type H+/Na+-transporting ATPase subunit alpha|nr:F0F1 ATP synthase subunit alpha [bacterium]MBT3903297.1 F0F1 ATP synthase subunit alpha [bacterium]MBT4577496.1 F0F1 ATP synthase subunit alpha [bacterium]MBT5345788.1 F0F1 ATP synthase subunit alpha [bacterium]MBT6130871.1 F0F1 ATP synthase subunit alpha [bacterium]